MVTRVDRANDRAHMFRAVVVNSIQARSHRTSNALIMEHIEHFTVSNGMSANEMVRRLLFIPSR
jgi:hypothetical protein